MNRISFEQRSPAPATMVPLDLMERTFLIVSLGWFLSHLLASLSLHPVNLFLAVSETLPVFFALIRKPGQISSSRIAWAVAIIGTFGPLFVLPVGTAVVSPAVSGSIMAVGLSISIAAKLSLNRRFGIVPANRGLARSGTYRYVRHPMYLGYIATHFGFLLGNLSILNVAVYAVTWTAFFCRMALEERLLSADAAYRDYCSLVRYRLLPGLY